MQSSEKIFDLGLRWLRIGWITIVECFRGSEQHLPIPWQQEDRPSVFRFGIDRSCGRARKNRQYDVRSAHPAYHALTVYVRLRAESVHPRSGRIDHRATND